MLTKNSKLVNKIDNVIMFIIRLCSSFLRINTISVSIDCFMYRSPINDNFVGKHLDDLACSRLKLKIDLYKNRLY